MEIRIKKGYKLKIAGQPDLTIEELQKPKKIAVLPERIPFIKPRLRVAEGDLVKIGTPLFEDKRNTRIVFLSPGSGEIEAINYGKRRVIREIVITLDEEEQQEPFQSISMNRIGQLKQNEIINLLIKGGLWPLIRELPFRDIASPESVPPSIIIALGQADYFQPSPECYLKGNETLFNFGLQLMRQLTDNIYICAATRHHLPETISELITHHVSGQYPAGDPGVLLYHIKKTPAENKAWYIDGQDLLLIASLLKNGSYPVKKIITIAGTAADRNKHLKARIGSPAVDIAGIKESNERLRFIAGGVFRGYTLPADSYLGFYESSLTIVPEGDKEEFFGFIRPGYKKQSYSRTFFSFFNRSDINMNCNLHGELRACINCGSCGKVCPVNILPQFAFKCIEADEIEEALAHGLLDCVECGLCTYVCPSKINIKQKMINAKAQYFKEQA